MVEPKRMLDGYGPGEMALPEFKLIQAVGGNYAKSLGAKPGQFFCPLDDSIVDELEIVVVDIQTTRTYWGRNEIEDSPPDCASLDAKSMRSITGEDCTTCSHRSDTPWLLKPQERRQMCNLSYNILGIKVDDFNPLLIRAGGISALPVRQLITQLRLNRALRGDYHKALISITSVKKKTLAGEAYTLHSKIKTLITDENKAQKLKDESLQLLGTPIALPEAKLSEQEPVAFTPERKPIYSGEEAEKLKELWEPEGKPESPQKKEPSQLDLNF